MQRDCILLSAHARHTCASPCDIGQGKVGYVDFLHRPSRLAFSDQVAGIVPPLGLAVQMRNAIGRKLHKPWASGHAGGALCRVVRGAIRQSKQARLYRGSSRCSKKSVITATTASSPMHTALRSFYTATPRRLASSGCTRAAIPFRVGGNPDGFLDAPQGCCYAAYAGLVMALMRCLQVDIQSRTARSLLSERSYAILEQSPAEQGVSRDQVPA